MQISAQKPCEFRAGAILEQCDRTATELTLHDFLVISARRPYLRGYTKPLDTRYNVNPYPEARGQYSQGDHIKYKLVISWHNALFLFISDLRECSVTYHKSNEY